MAEFAVWAPHAKKVCLQLSDVHRPLVMTRDGEWWRVDAPVNGATRYSFALDGGPAMPDPRSCCQPDGVHEASQVVDHRAFEWTDSAWKGIDLSRSVLYELHIGTFSEAGTFDGAIEKLDHLVDLGIDAIEIMPVAEFPGDRGWGYDGVCLYAPHHAYGGPEGLKRLVDACHEKGLGVVMDVVYNHLGPDGNYLGAYGPYFTERHQTPWGPAVNYDGPQSDGVREFVLGNAHMWLDCYHIDGLRLDAVHEIYDDSSKHIVAEIAERAHACGIQRGYPAFVIAESDLNDPKVVRSVEEGGWGTDAQWCDDFHHALHVALTGERSGYYVDYDGIDDLAKSLREAYVLTGQYSEFRHERRGEPTVGISPDHFVVYSQNHDQIGNRAKGERLSMLVDFRALDIASALTLLGPFVPMLFQGEEWGAKTPFLYFAHHSDPDLAKAVTAGRRAEFAHEKWDDSEVPDPQDRKTFERSKLDWSEMDVEQHSRLLAWYKTLVKLHHTVADFQKSDRQIETAGALLIMRRGAHSVIANFSDTVQVEGQTKLEPWSVKVGPSEHFATD